MLLILSKRLLLNSARTLSSTVAYLVDLLQRAREILIKIGKHFVVDLILSIVEGRLECLLEQLDVLLLQLAGLLVHNQRNHLLVVVEQRFQQF